MERSAEEGLLDALEKYHSEFRMEVTAMEFWLIVACVAIGIGALAFGCYRIVREQRRLDAKYSCKWCGGFFPSQTGGPCLSCFELMNSAGLDEDTCLHCGSYYDGGHRCGRCGNGDPLDTGEFDPQTGEQW